MAFSDHIKVISPSLSQIKNNTPVIKIGDYYLVGGIGGNFIPGKSGTDVSDTTATAATVLSEYKFHLKTGESVYGLIDTITPSEVSISANAGTITATYSAAKGYTAADFTKTATLTDSYLLAGNIKKDVTIFGITGTYLGLGSVVVQPAPSIAVSALGLITASYTPVAGRVADTTLKSQTQQLSVKAALTITPGTENKTISAGQYLTGDQVILGDSDLVAGNIKKDVTIFGVTGTYLGTITIVTQPTPTLSIDSSTGIVTASYIPIAGTVLDTSLKSATLSLSTKDAQTYTPTTSDQTIAASQYLIGVQTISGDANLVAANIAKDVTIFGVTGTHEGGTTDTFYKCATITPAAGDNFTLADADHSEYNGTYELQSGTGVTRVWKNSNDMYCYYNNPGENYQYVCFNSYSGALPGTAQYWGPGGTTLLPTDPWAATTWVNLDTYELIALTVTSTGGTGGTWTGYQLTMTSTGITYASTTTSGLSYTTTPEVNGIYNQNATKRIYEETLIAGNIKKDISILGVTGSYLGSSGLSAIPGYFVNTDGVLSFHRLDTSDSLSVAAVKIVNTGVALPLYLGKYSVDNLLITTPSEVNGTHLEVYISDTNTAASAVVFLDTTSATGRSKCLVYQPSGSSGAWITFPSGGITSLCASQPCKIDMSQATLPKYVFYRWKNGSSYGDWHSIYFPALYA